MPLDLQYHDLRPDKGLYYTLERQGRAERIVTEAAIYQPPHDTRAYFRGEPIKRIMMAEPLKGTRAHVQDLLANSPSAAELVKNLRA